MVLSPSSPEDDELLAIADDPQTLAAYVERLLQTEPDDDSLLNFEDEPIDPEQEAEDEHICDLIRKHHDENFGEDKACYHGTSLKHLERLTINASKRAHLEREFCDFTNNFKEIFDRGFYNTSYDKKQHNSPDNLVSSDEHTVVHIDWFSDLYNSINGSNFKPLQRISSPGNKKPYSAYDSSISDSSFAGPSSKYLLFLSESTLYPLALNSISERKYGSGGLWSLGLFYARKMLAVA
ncbi:hypothetical protein RhiirA4_478310 [Rhizophagus irregularis]|uniref:Uncharacterized protein n=1 Tax=Rhizophagus irregularis TaxID=588596 RepID=A0A2I1HEN2_9GLOM|nr:hypothetical protein RhiirA4_478310 [Rhizophagus irregularis]